MRFFFQSEAEKFLPGASQAWAFAIKLCPNGIYPSIKNCGYFMTMNEALAAQGVTVQLAQRVFAELYQTIIGHEPSVRRGEIEAIHDMRVATRRLRVALVNFAACWPKVERQRLKLWLQDLADALGEVRDLDVLAETLRPNLTELTTAEHPLLMNLIERLRKQRKRRFQTLLLFLESESYLSFKREFPRLFTSQ